MAQSQAAAGASDAQVAALIAAILAGSVVLGSGASGVSMATAIALVLETLVNPPGSPLSNEVAELVVAIASGPSVGSEANVARLTNNSGYSALYAVNATRRIQQALSKGEGLAQAVQAESSNAQKHREAVEQRDAGAMLNLMAARAYNSTTLNWHHLGTARTHRIPHELADGKNYEVLSPPRSTDGMLPAMAPNCDCEPGAPVRGAAMLR